MVLTYKSIFTENEIQSILDQQEVFDAKQRIDTEPSGSVYFSLSSFASG